MVCPIVGPVPPAEAAAVAVEAFLAPFPCDGCRGEPGFPGARPARRRTQAWSRVSRLQRRGDPSRCGRSRSAGAAPRECDGRRGRRCCRTRRWRATHVVLVSSALVYGAYANNPVPLTEDAVLRPDVEFAGRPPAGDRGGDGRSVAPNGPGTHGDGAAPGGGDGGGRHLLAGPGARRRPGPALRRSRSAGPVPPSRRPGLGGAPPSPSTIVSTACSTSPPTAGSPASECAPAHRLTAACPVAGSGQRGPQSSPLALSAGTDPSRVCAVTPAPRGWSPTTA